MQVIITNKDVSNLNKFMLLYSKNARKQRLVSTYAIPFEFLLMGIIIDGLLKTAPIASASSAVLAILWLIFYPKFYRRMLRKHLGAASVAQSSSAEMSFVADGETISFSKGEPRASEKFAARSLNRIAAGGENFFLAFDRGFHIVLPKNAETDAAVQHLAGLRELQIEPVDLDVEI